MTWATCRGGGCPCGDQALRAERDRARSIAVALEAENARLRAERERLLNDLLGPWGLALNPRGPAVSAEAAPEPHGSVLVVSEHGPVVRPQRSPEPEAKP